MLDQCPDGVFFLLVHIVQQLRNTAKTGKAGIAGAGPDGQRASLQDGDPGAGRQLARPEGSAQAHDATANDRNIDILEKAFPLPVTQFVGYCFFLQLKMFLYPPNKLSAGTLTRSCNIILKEKIERSGSPPFTRNFYYIWTKNVLYCMNRYPVFFLMATLFQFSTITMKAQDTGRFDGEVQRLIQQRDSLQLTAPILFVGSSTIRMWRWLPEDFPEAAILNMGFGGSQMSDLLHYAELLVVPARPGKIFIYEGDNDIAASKALCRIMRETRRLLRLLDQELASVPIVLISAKPSPSRWDKQKKYKKLNRRMEKLCERHSALSYADTWGIMLDEQGRPRADIFLEDQLHMNRKGYKLWAEALRPFL